MKINNNGMSELESQILDKCVEDIIIGRTPWINEIAALEERAARGDTIEVEISRSYTKSGRPEFIQLEPKHFNEEN